MSTIEVRKRTSSVHWDEHNLRRNEVVLSISRGSSFRKSYLGSDGPAVLVRDSVDGAAGNPWANMAHKSAQGSGDLNKRVGHLMSGNSAEDGAAGGPADQGGAAGLIPANKQGQGPKRTQSRCSFSLPPGSELAQLNPDLLNALQGLAEQSSSPAAAASPKLYHKQSSLREGSLFVRNALAVGRKLLEEEGDLDDADSKSKS